MDACVMLATDVCGSTVKHVSLADLKILVETMHVRAVTADFIKMNMLG